MCVVVWSGVEWSGVEWAVKKKLGIQCIPGTEMVAEVTGAKVCFCTDSSKKWTSWALHSEGVILP